MTRDRALEELPKLGVPTRPFFFPLSSLPAFPGREAAGWRGHPVAYDIAERGINLSSALNMAEDDLDTVGRGVRRRLGYQ